MQSDDPTTIRDGGPGSGFPTDYKERKEWECWTYLMEYMPDAFLEEVRVAIAGNQQHNPGQHLHWARGKSTDQMNTAFRHMWEHTMAARWGRGSMVDVDKCYHLAKAIWRLRAELQLTLERVRRENAALKGAETQRQELLHGKFSSEKGCDASGSGQIAQRPHHTD